MFHSVTLPAVVRCFCLWAYLWVCLGGFSVGFAGSSFAQGVDADAIERAVAGLGADDYLVRVQSEEKLLRFGRPAIDVVRQAVESPDIEIGIRAKRLLATLIDQDFAVRKKAFLAAGENLTKDLEFSQWKEFSAIVGQSKRSKQLFIEMLELHRKKISGVSESGVAGYLGYLAIEQEQYTPLPSSAVEIADELFKRLTAKPVNPTKQVEARDERDGREGLLVTQQLALSVFEANLPQTMVKTVSESEYAAEIDAMIAHWIRSSLKGKRLTHNQIETVYKFELSGFTKELAVELSDKKSEVSLQAAEAIAKTGGSDAIKLLQPFVKSDEVVVAYAEATTGTSIEITLGDYVFQLMLSLEGKPLKDFGLLPTSGTMRLGDLPVAGFADRQTANEAVRRWESDRQ